MYSLRSLIFAAVLAHGVIAGSRMWEAPLHYPSVDAPVEITLNLEGVNVTQVGTQSFNSTEKRWVTIKDGGAQGESRLLSHFKWPDKKIRFHFETEEAKQKLEVYLDAAKALWSAAGLPDEFTYEEVTSEADYEAKKGKILLVKYNDRNYLGTSLGLPTQDDNGPSPEMDLCDSEKIGTLNIVANFAHELGVSSNASCSRLRHLKTPMKLIVHHSTLGDCTMNIRTLSSGPVPTRRLKVIGFNSAQGTASFTVRACPTTRRPRPDLSHNMEMAKATRD